MTGVRTRFLYGFTNEQISDFVPKPASKKEKKVRIKHQANDEGSGDTYKSFALVFYITFPLHASIATPFRIFNGFKSENREATATGRTVYS